MAEKQDDPYCALAYWPHFACPDHEAAAVVTFYAATGKGKADKVQHSVRYCAEHTNLALQVALGNGYHVKAEIIEPDFVDMPESEDDD